MCPLAYGGVAAVKASDASVNGAQKMVIGAVDRRRRRPLHLAAGLQGAAERDLVGELEVTSDR